MAGDGGRRCRSRQAAAVVLVLCALAQSLTCFSLQSLREKVKQDEVVNEVMDLRTESILSDGKGSASAADGLLHIDSDQSDGSVPKGMSEQTSQLEDNMADEAAWRRLNPSLHCGQSKMKIKAMGPGAADLKLDMGDARPLPLIQVPETCGYSMRQNALGLILVVPYDGCNVIQENGHYVLLMSWLETQVKFTCPMLTGPATPPASTTPKPDQQPWELPFPLEPESLNRHKRHVYDPNSAYYNYMYYLYYMNTLRQTTTTKPDSTTVTTRPCIKKPPQTKPLAHPYNPYYLHNPYYNYYYPYYYPHQHMPGPIYYHQHYHGTPSPTQPTTTTKPCPHKTEAPTTNAPTTKPRPHKTTTKPCPRKTKPSSNVYPGPIDSYVPYHKLPFEPYVSYNKAGKLPVDLKHMPQAGYKSGPQARAHPGFNSWQPMPWLADYTGKDLQFDFKKLQPEQA